MDNRLARRSTVNTVKVTGHGSRGACEVCGEIRVVHKKAFSVHNRLFVGYVCRRCSTCDLCHKTIRVSEKPNGDIAYFCSESCADIIANGPVNGPTV